VRDEFGRFLAPLINFIDNRGLTSGELNYLTTAIMIASLEDVACGATPVHYNELSAAVAAVRDAADEFKRRLMDPYEDAAASKNGDLYATLVSKVPQVRAQEEKKP
jgi:hypothetical protein